MNERLVNAVLEQLTGEDAKQNAIDACEKGFEAGWQGFTYIHDCVEFFNANEEIIHEWLDDQAVICGYDDYFQLIRDWNDRPEIGEYLAYGFDGAKHLASCMLLEHVGLYLKQYDEEEEEDNACPHCGGEGFHKEEGFKRCGACNGKGTSNEA